jgi:mycoredoxin
MGDRIIVYRRDRCGYCWILERRLRVAGVDYDRRDIRADPEAAAFVRSVNDGDETVPTVVGLDGRVRVNPKPADLLRELGVAKPERRLRLPFRDARRD